MAFIKQNLIKPSEKGKRGSSTLDAAVTPTGRFCSHPGGAPVAQALCSDACGLRPSPPPSLPPTLTLQDRRHHHSP